MGIRLGVCELGKEYVEWIGCEVLRRGRCPCRHH